MGKQEKVPCPKCGELYAWNASKGRVRNHGNCQFDTPVQKKPRFRVVIAQPSNVSNVQKSNVPPSAPLSAAATVPSHQEDIEEVYRQNLLRNEQMMREGKLQYETFLKEKAAHDEKMRKEQAAREKEQAAREKAEADRLLQIELDKKRLYQPWKTALHIKPTSTSSAISVYWMDRNGGFYELHKDTPYTPTSPPPPTIHRRQKMMWCKVYWNSNFGVTTDLSEGEWEMQWAMKMV